MVLVAEVIVFVDEGLAQAGGVFFVDAEDDGLLQAIAALSLRNSVTLRATILVRSSRTSVRSKSLVL